MRRGRRVTAATAVAAVLFGAMLDGGHADLVFIAITGFMLLSVGSILLSQLLARRTQ